MSADDPTDDELEREAKADVPMAARRHGPRLSEESRAINPRALLEAERNGQSQSAFGFPDLGDPEVQRRVAQAHREEAARGRAEYEAVRPRQAAIPLRRPPGVPRTLAGRASFLSDLAELANAPTKDLRADATAWDRYLIAALELVTQLGHDDIEGAAVGLADRLLEERRRRFG